MNARNAAPTNIDQRKVLAAQLPDVVNIGPRQHQEVVLGLRLAASLKRVRAPNLRELVQNDHSLFGRIHDALEALGSESQHMRARTSASASGLAMYLRSAWSQTRANEQHESSDCLAHAAHSLAPRLWRRLSAR